MLHYFWDNDSKSDFLQFDIAGIFHTRHWIPHQHSTAPHHLPWASCLFLRCLSFFLLQLRHTPYLQFIFVISPLTSPAETWTQQILRSFLREHFQHCLSYHFCTIRPMFHHEHNVIITSTSRTLQYTRAKAVYYDAFYGTSLETLFVNSESLLQSRSYAPFHFHLDLQPVSVFRCLYDNITDQPRLVLFQLHQRCRRSRHMCWFVAI